MAIHGEMYTYDAREGWRGPRELELHMLRHWTPPPSPSLPDWPQTAAEAARDKLGATIAYVRHWPPARPGVVYGPAPGN